MTLCYSCPHVVLRATFTLYVITRECRSYVRRDFVEFVELDEAELLTVFLMNVTSAFKCYMRFKCVYVKVHSHVTKSAILTNSEGKYQFYICLHDCYIHFRQSYLDVYQIVFAHQ